MLLHYILMQNKIEVKLIERYYNPRADALYEKRGTDVRRCQRGLKIIYFMNKHFDNLKLILGVLFISILLIIFGVQVYKANSKDNIIVSDNVICEYNSLFNTKLKTCITYNNSRRSPISLLEYRKYSILISKFDLKLNFNINDIQSSIYNTRESDNVIYNVVRENNYNLLVLSDSAKIIKKINLMVEGDLLVEKCKNDTIVCYNL
jgi:hypothetical protein